MKKIVALLLALVCVFALASCGGPETPEGPDYSDLEAFKAAITASAPAGAVITVELENTISTPLMGTFTVTYGEENAVVEYEYDQFLPIDPSAPAESDRETVTGTATIDKNGTVTGDLNSTVTAATLLNYNLDGTKMTYIVEAGILSANISAANTESVLGVNIGADVTFTLAIFEGKVVSVTLNYQAATGAAEITTTYTYA